MDIHHDTSFRYILEDDSVFPTSKARIHSCSSKGAGLWLVVRPSICSFHITHFTFTSTLCFRFGLIQPLASNLLTCECGHGLNASGTHLARCSFGGQRITTHDNIKNVMYAFARKSGFTIWRKWWYAIMLEVSLQTNLYMIHEDYVFVVNVVVINPTWKMVATNIIS